MNVDDGLKDISWIHGLGGEKLPVASYALLPNQKKDLFFAIGERSRFFVACFLHSSAQMSLYQTPGRRPSRIIGRFVNTVTRGWVGAPMAEFFFFLFSVFLEKFETFFRRFAPIANGTETVWRVSLNFGLFFGNIAFPLSPV